VRRGGLILASTLLALGLLAGCEVGPDFLRPAAPPVTSYTPEPLAEKTAAADVAAGQAQRFTGGLDIPGEWWTLFHSAPLDQLIAEALKANPSLEAAQAALRQARENVYAEEGALFPSVTANGSATREKVSGASFGIPGLSSTLGVTTASLNVSYALDVFGGVRRQIESLEAEEEFQRFQLEAAYLTLTSNVVVAAVGEASLRAQVAATEDIIQIETQELGVLQKQLVLGGASKAAVLAQQATLSQAQATLPPLQRQLAQTRNQLAALAGHYPSEVPAGKFELATMHLPDDLPLSLPSKLVEQRPDVRAAEAELHAASANIGVATANQLPQFNITAELGTASLGFAQLFSPGTGIWSIGGSVAQTVFDAGTLLHKKRAAVAAYEQAAARYRNTVLTAFQNVADALRALQSDADAVKAQAEAVHSAADSLAISRDQYQAGAITYTALLTAEQTYQQARIALVQAQANRFADTAALFQALGGGWWNRSDIAANIAGEPERFWLPPLPPARN
jgi:NodT family efflux transporter outer membrane factor (OMF) lipoprotein